MFEHLDVKYAEQVGLVVSASLSARRYACLRRQWRLALDYYRQGNQIDTALNSGVPRCDAMTSVTPMVSDRLQQFSGDKL